MASVNFIIFSGDITFFGLPEEYEASRENLFDPVLRATGQTSDCLFMVPGNHDLNRHTVYEMLPKDLLSTFETDALVNKWLTDEKRLRRVLEPFEAYTQFVERYTGQPQPSFASINQLNVNGVDVAILGLNSAWMSGRNKDDKGEVNDYGYLLVGEPQIHDALREVSNTAVRIAVLHHPFKWLKGFEQSKIESGLKQACHFILHGHEHEPGADSSKGLQGECMTIPGGASYERRKADDPRYVNSYNLVHLDLDGATGIVFFRKWSERRKAWIADIDSHEDGKFQFTLPKQLGLSSPTPSRTSGVTVSQSSILEADYRRQTIETFKDLSFKGLTASVRPIRLPLEKIYVQLRAVAEVPEAADEFTPEERRVLRWMEEEREGQKRPEDLREAELRLDALRRERWTKDRLERFPIADALKDPKRRGLVILGDPGSGKTTLLHFLTLIFARGPEAAAEQLKITLEEADRLPIFAPLAAYDDMLNHDASLTMRDFLAKYYAQRRAMPGLASLFEEAIDSGRALILLDGMDEVLAESRRKFVADQASVFIRALIYRGNRVLLTSRIYGYRVAPLSVEMPHVTVLDFRREEIEVFASQWNRAMAEWEYAERSPEERQLLARTEERTLLDEINSNPGVERLAANPLLLSMLALLRRQVGRLPQQRIRLYALYLGTLIDAWEASRSPGARVNSPARPEAGRAELILIPLAFWLQQNKPSGTATQAEILTQIIAVFLREEGLPPETPEDTPMWRESEQRARTFLDDMRSFSGLLVERGQGAFGFRHLTFQEYYVGRALARMEELQRWELLHANLHANRWREPILLAAAQLGTIQTDEDACTKLVNNILDAKSPHEDVLHRDLLLAADCASDDINVGLMTLRLIVDRLKPLTFSPISVLSTEVVHRLLSLAMLSRAGKPRLSEAIDALVAAVSESKSYPLWLGQFIPMVSSLFQLYPSILAALVRKLDDEAYNVQATAIQSLSGFLGDDQSLRDTVTLKLNAPSNYVRAAAIEALTALLGDDFKLRETIALKLDDESYDVRAVAIQALSGLLGDDADLREVVALKLDDQSPKVRAAAIKALAGLVGDDLKLREAIALTLNDESYIVRVAGIQAVAGWLGDNVNLREAVALKLDDPDNDVRAAAIQALAGLLRDDPDLRETIALKLHDRWPNVRVAAIQALADLLGDYVHLRESIAVKLDDESHYVRAATIRSIIQFRFYKNRILGLLRHQDWRTRRDTVQVLAEILGRNEDLALPISHVLDDLQCQEASRMRTGTIKALADLLGADLELRDTVASKLDDQASEVRQAAIQALTGLLGDDFKLRNAVALKLDDEASEVQKAAIQALAGLLSDNLYLREPIVLKLGVEWPSVQEAAIQALGSLLGDDLRLRDAVALKLHEPDPSVQVAAIQALAGLLRTDVKLRETIELKLENESYYVRQAAIHALGGLFGDNGNLRDAVALKLNDPDEDVRTAAIQALTASMGDDIELRETIALKLEDESYSVRAAAIRSLSGFLGDDQSLRDTVTLMLDDPVDDVQAAAVEVLTALLGDDFKLRETIALKLDDKSYHVRAAAIQLLSGFLGDDADLREVIALKLDDQSSMVRAAAIKALAGLVGDDLKLREAIALTLNDESYIVRVAGIQALAGWLGDNLNLREAVALKLDDPHNDVRAAAIQALAQFISEPDLRMHLALGLKADPVIFEFTTHGNPRTALIRSWGRWAVKDPRGRPEVIEMLGSQDWRLRFSGAEIAIAGGADFVQPALPQLLGAMDNQNGLDSWPARIAAAELLINHSRYRHKTIDLLLSALDYAVEPLVIVPMAGEIRTSAAVALGKLKAEEYQPDTAEKLKAKLQTERDPKVLDSLFNALLSLASAPA